MTKILTRLSELRRASPDAVECWFSEMRRVAPPHLTTSVDMRHDGLRLVPVDVNIYPAGFQNLSESGKRRAAIHFDSGIKLLLPDAERVLIVPESHTRNLPYLDNLDALSTILAQAGFDVRIGSLTAKPGELISLETKTGKFVHQSPLVLKNKRLQTEDGFIPDIILLNYDGTGGMAEALKHIAQPILPSPDMGWFQRRKSRHFMQYAELATQFAGEFGFDPWLIHAEFTCARHINFKQRSGVDDLARKVDELILRIKSKHAAHGIHDDPFVYVKADSGTYGMGIMMVQSGGEVLEMNKKQRNKMHVIKDGAEVHDVLLQEGIKTVDMVDGKPAEPMVYLVDGVPVGGMFRVNSQRDQRSNLNASGMEYISMCDEHERAPHAHQVDGCDFSAYGMIAAMSALAAGREEYGASALTQDCA